MELRRRAVPALILTLGLLIPAAALRAQGSTQPYKSVLTLNPLGIPFEYISGEYERVVSGLVTGGLTFSYLGLSDDSYLTWEGKLRFYPNEEAPKGFSIGLSAGITRLEGERFDGTSNVDDDIIRPTIGVIIDYNWLLGRNKRFLVGAGVGGKRILGPDHDWVDLNVGYPTARFQVGFLF